MKRSEAKITVTLRQVFDADRLSGWEYICNKYGINEYCLKEGLEDTHEIQISLEDAEYIGLIED